MSKPDVNDIPTPDPPRSNTPYPGPTSGISPTLVNMMEEDVYFNLCGWNGFEWGGQKRVHFRFSDSDKTGT